MFFPGNVIFFSTIIPAKRSHNGAHEFANLRGSCLLILRWPLARKAAGVTKRHNKLIVVQWTHSCRSDLPCLRKKNPGCSLEVVFQIKSLAAVRVGAYHIAHPFARRVSFQNLHKYPAG